MNKRYLLILMFYISCNFSLIFAQNEQERTEDITGIKSSFTYGNNLNFASEMESLKADIYKPSQNSSHLPLIIIYHGGGYASGDRNQPILKSFANVFNAANISAVVPDFRQGWYSRGEKTLCESANAEKFEDAAYRAYQDNRALIRYCKANAIALGIDSNRIFLFGISSGGYLVLHHLYFNESLTSNERVQRLGLLDGQGNDFKNSTDVAGIISAVGGFYASNPTIQKNIPILLFNNTCDIASDFFNGWLGNCSNTVQTYGPGVFTKTLEQYFNPYQLHVFCGYTHSFVTETSPLEADPLTIQYISKFSIEFVTSNLNDEPVFKTFIASDSMTSIPLGKCTNFETFYWCKEDSIGIEDHFIQLAPSPISCLLSPKLNIRHPKKEVLSITILDEFSRVITEKKVMHTIAQQIIYLSVDDFVTGINILLVKNEEGKIIYKTKTIRYCEF